MPEEQPRADSFSTTSPDSAAVPSLYPGPPLLYSCNRHVISLIRLYVVLRGMRAYKARNATSQKRNTHRFWASGFFFFSMAQAGCKSRARSRLFFQIGVEPSL
jgi:hypothetical protein